MIVKNWQAIAKIENDDLRRFLCNTENQKLLKFIVSMEFNGIDVDQLIDLMRDMDLSKVNFSEYLTEDTPVQGIPVPAMVGDPSMSIEELGLSVCTYNALKRASLYTVGDILKQSSGSILSLRTMGRIRFNELNWALKRNGFTPFVEPLSLGGTVDLWPLKHHNFAGKSESTISRDVACLPKDDLESWLRKRYDIEDLFIVSGLGEAPIIQSANQLAEELSVMPETWTRLRDEIFQIRSVTSPDFNLGLRDLLLCRIDNPDLPNDWKKHSVNRRQGTNGIEIVFPRTVIRVYGNDCVSYLHLTPSGKTGLGFRRLKGDARPIARLK